MWKTLEVHVAYTLACGRVCARRNVERQLDKYIGHKDRQVPRTYWPARAATPGDCPIATSMSSVKKRMTKAGIHTKEQTTTALWRWTPLLSYN